MSLAKVSPFFFAFLDNTPTSPMQSNGWILVKAVNSTAKFSLTVFIAFTITKTFWRSGTPTTPPRLAVEFPFWFSLSLTHGGDPLGDRPFYSNGWSRKVLYRRSGQSDYVCCFGANATHDWSIPPFLFQVCAGFGGSSATVLMPLLEKFDFNLLAIQLSILYDKYQKRVRAYS